MRIIGSVSEEEKNEIRNLHERILSLEEMVIMLKQDNKDADNCLYKKVVADLRETKRTFEQWWSEKAMKYSWGIGTWQIVFSTNNILIIE